MPSDYHSYRGEHFDRFETLADFEHAYGSYVAKHGWNTLSTSAYQQHLIDEGDRLQREYQRNYDSDYPVAASMLDGF